MIMTQRINYKLKRHERTTLSCVLSRFIPYLTGS